MPAHVRLDQVNSGQVIVEAIELSRNGETPDEALDPDEYPQIANAIEWVKGQLGEESEQQLREYASSTLLSMTRAIYDQTIALAGDFVSFLIGIVVQVLALYYFFADGESLLKEIRRLSPLETIDEDKLIEQFNRVCRGVVIGTVLAALIQGILAGVGFFIIGVQPLWLLAVFTMFFSFIPFLGAASVWICVSIGLAIDQQYGAAVFMVMYGAIVISGSDNLLKAYVIHDRAKMHPLVALVTVLGALQLVGLWGIFVGPISAAFFYALLKILKQRLIQSGREEKPQSSDSESSSTKNENPAPV